MANPEPAGSDKPAVALIHGFALDARMWRRQVESLTNDHRVVTIDLPGFGPQARELGRVEPAKEIGRALDAAGLRRAHIVASEFGAAAAIDFAFQSWERVASLTLASPILLGRKLAIDAWHKCISLANDGDRATAAEVWLDDALFESVRHDDELFEEVRQIVLDYAGGHWTGKVTPAWGEPDPFPRLKELEIPSLVISGENDMPSFLAMADAYAKSLPRARREIIQGAGHHVSMEAADAFNRLVRTFISAC